MANNDYGFQELLDVIKKNPQLIKEVVFDPTSIQALLPSKTAQKLAEGLDPLQPVDPQTFLNYMASPDDGYPVAMCSQETTYLNAKGTQFRVAACGSGTQK